MKSLFYHLIFGAWILGPLTGCRLSEEAADSNLVLDFHEIFCVNRIKQRFYRC